MEFVVKPQLNQSIIAAQRLADVARFETDQPLSITRRRPQTDGSQFPHRATAAASVLAAASTLIIGRVRRDRAAAVSGKKTHYVILLTCQDVGGHSVNLLV